MTHWFVTGGAGYIGAHVAQALLDSGREVTVLDDLSSGRREFVPDGARFVQGSLLDRAALEAALSSGPTGVVHLAAFKYAGESTRRPLHTYQQNVAGTMQLLAAMRDAQVAKMVFSSSAGVYGTPAEERVTEQTPTHPESPYGESKLIGEWMLRNEALANEGFRCTALRYFNVIGSGGGGVFDVSPHNLVPMVFRALRQGETPRVNGNDYPTRDGTNVRDYVHVSDVALAHRAAVDRLENGLPIEPVYNLGSGAGTSNLELMRAISIATDIDFEPEFAPRRPGDPASIVADGTLAARDLDWRMRHTVDEMVESAWAAAQGH